jgi:tetratricopeptide (TPR) repeat protein
MPTLDGKNEPLLGKARVSVFVFFRPAQDHSLDALRELTELERELQPKGVRFVAVTSDSYPKEDVRRVVAESGLRMPVLIDVGDALYGELGVMLHPSIGIVNEKRILSSCQPFRKINLADATRGRIRLALGEIDETQLAAILDPPAAPVASGGRAHARLKLARVLLGSGQIEQAVASARSAIAIDPALGEAHAVLAEGLARAGECEEAARERDAAQRLAPAVRLAALSCAKR